MTCQVTPRRLGHASNNWGRTPPVLGAWPARHAYLWSVGLYWPASVGTVTGGYGVADQRRAGTKDAVAQLHCGWVSRVAVLGYESIGAIEAVSSAMGGLPADRPTGRLPQSEVRLVRTIAAGNSGGVAMIGDGINDLRDISVATVGIAVGTASADVAHALTNVSIFCRLPDPFWIAPHCCKTDALRDHHQRPDCVDCQHGRRLTGVVRCS